MKPTELPRKIRKLHRCNRERRRRWRNLKQ
uniref:Uncharacterized protein n=1 Tax=Myoviridae sp. ctq9w2 TaxID=2825177 RepID=A0A8S5PY18_9CAUD|nr:MAG TPA: hypothetical protein [Myoviridae sp. ctq9w2]